MTDITTLPEARWTTLTQAWDEEMHAVGRAPGTRQKRLYHVHRFANAHATMSPADIDVETVARWFGAQTAWKPNTRRSYRASLFAFYKWAHKRGKINQNPLLDFAPVKVPRSVSRPAPSTVVDLALRNTGIRERMMVLVLANTGMRRGELAVLHSDHLEQEPTLELGIPDWEEGWCLRITGKGQHVRTVPMSDQLARILRLLPRGYVFPGQVAADGKLLVRTAMDNLKGRVEELIDGDIRTVSQMGRAVNSRQRRQLPLALAELQRDGRIELTKTGQYRMIAPPIEPAGHLSASHVGKLVSRALGDNKWTAHSLRHRYATLAYAVERDILAVRDLLGHASVTTTQIYTYVPQSSLRIAAAGAQIGLSA